MALGGYLSMAVARLFENMSVICRSSSKCQKAANANKINGISESNGAAA